MKVCICCKNQNRDESIYLDMLLKCYSSAGIEHTFNVDDDYDILHISKVEASCFEIIQKAKKKGAKIVFYTDTAQVDLKDRFIIDKSDITKIEKVILKLYTRSKCIIVPDVETKKVLHSFGVLLPIYISRLSYIRSGENFNAKHEGQKLLYIYNSLFRENKKNIVKNNKPLNIAIFSDTYPPDINGVSISVDTLRRSLENLGHNVYVVVPTESTKFLGIVSTGGLLRIPGISIKFLYGYKLARPFSTKAITILMKNNIDIVHIHTDFSMRFFAESVSKLLKTPIIYTYHTMYEDYTHYFAKGPFVKIAKKIVRSLVRVLNRKCAYIVAPTDKTMKTLRKYKIRVPIDIIPTGIDIEKFKELSPHSYDVTRIKDEYNLHNKFCYIYLGRIAKEKSVDKVILAFSKVCDKMENAVLLIVGYGPDQENLEKLVISLKIENKVLFLGKCEHFETPIFYKTADVFVSASESETQGITYIEALASGLPVIAKNDECVKDIIATGYNGIVYETDEELADAFLKYYLADKDILLKQKENSIKKSDEFSIEAFGKKVLDVYYKAISAYNTNLK